MGIQQYDPIKLNRSSIPDSPNEVYMYRAYKSSSNSYARNTLSSGILIAYTGLIHWLSIKKYGIKHSQPLNHSLIEAYLVFIPCPIHPIASIQAQKLHTSFFEFFQLGLGEKQIYENLVVDLIEICFTIVHAQIYIITSV